MLFVNFKFCLIWYLFIWFCFGICGGLGLGWNVGISGGIVLGGVGWYFGVIGNGVIFGMGEL